MPRPKTKDELLKLSEENYKKLITQIIDMEKQGIDMSFDFKGMDHLEGAHWQRDEHVSDVIMHLYAWHHLLIDWIMKNVRALDKPFLPKPYTFKTYGLYNEEIQKKYKDTSLNDALKMIRKTL